MEGLITLADLPELSGTDPAPKSTIVVARLDDKLYDPRYGRFAIAQSDVDGWKRNLSETFGGRVSIDFDHSSDRGGGTKAAAWITGLAQQGDDVTAAVEWTPTGAKSVRDGDYKYISPTFVPNFVDEHKESHGKALIGAALTNRPVLRKGMPTLSLSKDRFDDVATLSGKPSSPKRERKRARKQAALMLASNADGARDSRAQMDLAELAKQLDLPADADHVTVLAAVAALKPATGAPTTLAAPNADADAAQKASKKAAKKLAKQNGKRTMALDAEGNVLLDAAGLAELVSAANAGQAAALQLAEQTFTHAWEKALSEGRAAPAQEDTMRALFRKDQEIAIKTLDSFVPIVPIKPTGSGEGVAADAPMGMEQDRYQLHTEAKALAEQKMAANPKLDEADAYTLAAIEIEDKKFTLENPGI
jgi:hypothetical protein